MQLTSPTGTWQYAGTAGFSAGTVRWTSVAVSATNVPYLAYQDASAGDKAQVRFLSGSSWLTLPIMDTNQGTFHFSVGEVSCGLPSNCAAPTASAKGPKTFYLSIPRRRTFSLWL